MNPFVDFIGVLFHTIGLLMFGGGEVWISFLMAKAQSSKNPHGNIFVIEILEPIAKVMFIGLTLLIIGGILRMIGTDTISLWADMETRWGTIFILKHILVGILFISGLLISVKITPLILKYAPKSGRPPSKAFMEVTSKMEKFAKTNLFLTMVVVVLSVMAVTLSGL